MSRLLLKLNDLTKSFGAVQALRGVSFDLRAGEIHALVGENGAGKSTLIRLVSGGHQPDGGSIEFEGQVAKNLTPVLARAHGVACIYQQPALFPDLSVAENIALRLESNKAWRRVRWAERATTAAHLLRRIGANISPDTEASALSMPEQQLVEIACAVGSGARIVIMDEPTASLTQKEQYLLFTLLRELRAAQVGVIYISHRLEEIFAVADRITVLRDGENVGTRSVSEVDEAELIRLMVGREITRIYPESNSTPAEVGLVLRKVSCAANGISDISLEVRRGEILGLSGLVGAGRTELARTIFGIDPATSGQILIDGTLVQVNSTADAIAHGIGYLPEDRRQHGVVLEMPVSANITLAAHAKFFPNGWLRPALEKKVAQEFMAKLSIKASDSNAIAAALSGGNQQKVALARWLATGPGILILDEPTQGVDVAAKSEIHKLIRQLAADGLAVLLISSDLQEIVGMSDRIAVMRGGRIITTLPRGTAPQAVMAAAFGQVVAA